MGACAIAVAIFSVVFIAIPSSTWTKPSMDQRYEGFEPNLMYTDPRGAGSVPGVISIAPAGVQLDAGPFSDPTIQLITSPLSFETSMDVRVIATQGFASPLTTCLANAITSYRACLVFGPPPGNNLSLRTLSDKAVIAESYLGTYQLDQSYRVDLTFDGIANRFSGVVHDEPVPFGGNTLLVAGGRTLPIHYADIVSTPIAVQPDVKYSFGGFVRALLGSDAYKLNVVWLDKEGNVLGFSNDWQPISQLSGWTNVRFHGTAPQRAAFAQVHLAAGDGTEALFAQLFLQASTAGPNLISNPNFTNGSHDWSSAGTSGGQLDVLTPSSPINTTFSVDSHSVAPLFAYFRHYLYVSAPSDGGTSTVRIEHYVLTLPAQTWVATKVADHRATTLALFLAIAAAVLVLARVLVWIGHHAVGAKSVYRFATRPTNYPKWLLIAGLACVVYIVGNAFLFHFGTMPFDMISQQIWSYTGATYGMPQMYYLPFTSASLAPLWSGAPLSEPGYAYGITTAYYYTAIGWVEQLFLNGPGPVVATAFTSEFLIKLLNVIFGLADGAIIFSVLRHNGVTARQSATSSLFFLLNPAVWFAMSIWGQIETVAIFLVLLAIWFIETERSLGAWLAIIAAAFAKPQVMLLAPLLALLCLRRFSLRTTVSALSWSLLVGFLLLSPFILSIGPSLPIDVALKVANVFGGAIDPTQNSVGGGSYSLWPLLTSFMAGQSHLARFGYPSTSPFAFGLSYNDASNFLWISVIAVVSLVLLMSRRVGSSSSRYMPFLALGMLGFLMFKTGMVSRYFVYAIPFVVLMRTSVPRSTYYLSVAAITITTFVSMFGEFGVETGPVPWAAPAFHQAGAGLTSTMVSLYSSDWFITWAVVANLVVLTLLAAAAISALVRPLPASLPNRAVPST